MKPLVSVIVPVYKVEPYLERCLDSLVNQTLKEIEIIVIDDGSPDRCGEICDAYAARDERFRVVHQENAGVSAARNVGIELAKADYLMFADSDDLVDPEFCRLPYEAAAEHGADLVMFQFWRISGRKKRICAPDDLDGIKSRDVALRMLYHGSSMIVVNKMYHKKLFQSLRFPEGRFYEDHAVTHKAVYTAHTIFYFRKPLYYYYRRKGSTTQSPTHKMIKDRFEMDLLHCRDLYQWGYAEEATQYELNQCLLYLVSEGRHGVYSEECIARCRALRCIPGSISWKRRSMLMLLRYFPVLFDLACILFGRRVQ